MRTVEEYLIHAAKADELAGTTDDAFHKEQIAKIAAMWRDLAEHRRLLAQADSE
jgi:hypothetical protein